MAAYYDATTTQKPPGLSIVKTMWNEFKTFAVRGNVIDLAVGLIIGAAFGRIVTALVDGVVMPPLGLLLGRVDFLNLFWVLQEGAQPGPYASLEAARTAGAVTLAYGEFINTLVNFLVVAFAIFLLVKGINKIKAAEPPPAPVGPSSEELLTEIRDLLKKGSQEA